MNTPVYCLFNFEANLTLTRVVFEYNQANSSKCGDKHLTLTRVVFEFWNGSTTSTARVNLTLTRVVFELRYSERSDRQK